jgi:hypothetical protein
MHEYGKSGFWINYFNPDRFYFVDALFGLGNFDHDNQLWAILWLHYTSTSFILPKKCCTGNLVKRNNAKICEAQLL